MATVHNNLTVGKTYAVTTAGGCTITDEDGNTVKVFAANSQGVFVAQTPSVTLSDDNALLTLVFNSALALDGNGGGGTITIDPTPTQGSDNAVSSGGVFTALRELPAPVPETLEEDTAMRNGGVYTVDAAYEATTLSLPPNATAEIWVRIGATAFNVSLPDSWVWVNGEASDMTGKTNTTFCIAVRNDGVKVLASMQYSYENTPAQ